MSSCSAINASAAQASFTCYGSGREMWDVVSSANGTFPAVFVTDELQYPPCKSLVAVRWSSNIVWVTKVNTELWVCVVGWLVERDAIGDRIVPSSNI